MLLSTNKLYYIFQQFLIATYSVYAVHLVKDKLRQSKENL